MPKKASAPKTKLKTRVEKSEEAPIQQPKFNWSIVAVVICLAGILLLLRSFKGKTDEFKNKQIPDAIKKVLNSPSTKFEVTSVTDTSGVYEFVLKLNGQSYTSYLTKDAKILFTSGVKLADLDKQKAAATTTDTQQKKLTCSDLKKADTGELTAFVVSNCPYGLQMQRVFKKAIADAPDLAANLDIKYIGAIENGKITSMHGDEEAKENLRQICIRDEQKDLYWPYVGCYMQNGKTDECVASSGVDKAQLDACVADPKRGLAFAQKDFDAAKQLGVSGSPTLILNGKQTVSEFDFGGRTENSIKTIACCGSKTQGASCSKELSTKDLPTAFSLTDEVATGTTTTTSAAGCAPAK